ncbi:MAG: tRNA (adenine-N1)-methyltransferase [Actinomycetia bacterium]|nr:tRNA (adenine-N1)-methyltransferase [Actinomycetes bacterium]
MNQELAEGDLVQLIDNKGRRYQGELTAGKEFHFHSGIIGHDELIGLPEGSVVRSSRSQVFTVLRPSLSEFILKMPRGAQVIYPKDLGPILMLADIGPGMRVLESGVGSGALSMAMLRCGVEITGYEIREDFANRATANVERFLGAEALARYDVQLRDCYEGIDPADDARPFDRVVLDLPEPWRVVPHAAEAMRSGGIFCAYTPSIVQVTQLRDALDAHGFFASESLEVMNRGWHIEGKAVRPDHRMVAHTGFLTHARLGAG